MTHLLLTGMRWKQPGRDYKLQIVKQEYLCQIEVDANKLCSPSL